MKKIAALLLALSMMISIVACGGNKNNETTTNNSTTVTTDGTTAGSNTTTDANVTTDTTATTTEAPVTSAVSVEDAANAVISKVAALTDDMLVPMGMSMEAGYLTGFNNEVSGFSECYAFMPMIGTIPFVGYVFRVSDAANAEAYLETLKSDSNPRWNLCTAADTTVTAIHGDLILFVMCSTENLGTNCETELRGAFEAAVK